MGADPSHIYFLNAKHNWWIPGTSGPCGPDTEIFFDTGKEKCCDECSPACDCGKYLEIWNNVFMQYFQPANGEIRMLEKKNVDTGMGLERTIATFLKSLAVFSLALRFKLLHERMGDDCQLVCGKMGVSHLWFPFCGTNPVRYTRLSASG